MTVKATEQQQAQDQESQQQENEINVDVVAAHQEDEEEEEKQVQQPSDDDNDEEAQQHSHSSSSSSKRPFPEPFYCPVTNQVMNDPVVGPDGQSYEKSAAPQPDDDDPSVEYYYYPNRALKAMIEREMELQGKTIRGSIRKIQESARRQFGSLLEKSAFPNSRRLFRPLAIVILLSH